MSLFNFLFVLYAVPHIFFGVDIVNMPIEEGRVFLAQVLWQIGLMLVVMTLWLSKAARASLGRSSPVGLFESVYRPKAAAVFYALMLIILIAVLFFIKGDIIYGGEDSYIRYAENLRSVSGLPEYLLVLFFLSALLRRNGLQKAVWYIVLLIFSIKVFLLGFRITLLMSSLLALWFSGVKLSPARLITVFIFGFFMFSILGLLKTRVDFDFILSGLFFEMQNGNLVSHHGNVLWASSVILELLHNGYIDLYQRLDFLFFLIINTLVPSSVIPKLTGTDRPSDWLQALAPTGGGVHAATFAYLTMGVFGVVLISSYFGAAGALALSRRRGLLIDAIRCWFLMTLVTFPRWISYDIGNFLFRLPIYASIGYVMIVLSVRAAGGRQRAGLDA